MLREESVNSREYLLSHLKGEVRVLHSYYVGLTYFLSKQRDSHYSYENILTRLFL